MYLNQKKSLLAGKWRSCAINVAPHSYDEKYLKKKKKKTNKKADILYFYYNFNNMSKLKSLSKAIT